MFRLPHCLAALRLRVQSPEGPQPRGPAPCRVGPGPTHVLLLLDHVRRETGATRRSELDISTVEIIDSVKDGLSAASTVTVSSTDSSTATSIA